MDPGQKRKLVESGKKMSIAEFQDRLTGAVIKEHLTAYSGFMASAMADLEEKDGNTLLLVACQSNDDHLASRLAAKGFSVKDYRESFWNEVGYLHLAQVEMMLKYGASAYAFEVDSHQQTVFHLVCQRKTIPETEEKRHTLLSILVKALAVCDQTKAKGSSCSDDESREDFQGDQLELLDVPDNQKMRALDYAVANNDLEAVDILIAGGAKQCLNALDIACTNGNLAAVKKFFNTPHYQMAIERSLLEEEAKRRTSMLHWSLLEIAASEGRKEVVEYLVCEQTGYLEKFGQDALFKACTFGHGNVVNFLANQAGINLDAQFCPQPPKWSGLIRFASWDVSPLQFACEQGFFECVQALVLAGAKTNILIHQASQEYNNLIGSAILGQNPAVLQLLLDHGLPPSIHSINADSRPPTQFEDTASILAMRKGSAAILQLLLLSGTDCYREEDPQRLLLAYLSCDSPDFLSTLVSRDGPFPGHTGHSRGHIVLPPLLPPSTWLLWLCEYGSLLIIAPMTMI